MGRFKTMLFRCPACDSEQKIIVDQKEDIEGTVVICKECGETMKSVFGGCNISTMRNEHSDKTIAARKKSFGKRFKEKEYDDLMHKHGSTFGDSLAKGAVERAKKGEE